MYNAAGLIFIAVSIAFVRGILALLRFVFKMIGKSRLRKFDDNPKEAFAWDNTMNSNAEENDLKKQNEALKQQLQEYKALEEDLMANRVFEKAKKQFIRRFESVCHNFTIFA